MFTIILVKSYSIKFLNILLYKHNSMLKKTNSNKRHVEKDSSIDQLSRDELKELLMINTYKLALTRAQIDALVDIMIKKGITTYDEVWKRTNEIFKENKRE
jgi:hypothetical protein